MAATSVGAISARNSNLPLAFSCTYILHCFFTIQSQFGWFEPLSCKSRLIRIAWRGINLNTRRRNEEIPVLVVEHFVSNRMCACNCAFSCSSFTTPILIEQGATSLRQFPVESAVDFPSWLNCSGIFQLLRHPLLP